jgi:hypothetical protein
LPLLAVDLAASLVPSSACIYPSAYSPTSRRASAHAEPVNATNAFFSCGSGVAQPPIPTWLHPHPHSLHSSGKATTRGSTTDIWCLVPAACVPRLYSVLGGAGAESSATPKNSSVFLSTTRRTCACKRSAGITGARPNICLPRKTRAAYCRPHKESQAPAGRRARA